MSFLKSASGVPDLLDWNGLKTSKRIGSYFCARGKLI
jgi:hypothetical protein